jgi:pyruvate dehydrogenase E1 component beta subunit
MPNCTMIEAINDALAVALAEDERVVVLGEDVGCNGGVFRASDGLQQRFGADRVVDTPLSEAGILGTAVGLAMYGMRPIAEIQFLGFTYQAFSQLLGQAARARWRSRGSFPCPLVVRAPAGAGVHAPELHSDMLEAHFVHTPGLKVVAPSHPYDAKGLLLAALDDPDPVVFIEPLRGYRSHRSAVPEGRYTVPIGQADVTRPGRDVTIIAWSFMVRVALEVAEVLGRQGVDAEVIDLRTLSPLDTPTIIESVQRTGRAVIVHEAAKTAGLAAEISAQISERALLYLEAPVLRVTGFDVPLPPAMLEEHYLPTPARIAESVQSVLTF